MKKYFAIFRMMMLGALVLPMVSCEKEAIEEPTEPETILPELTVPDDYINYFEEGEISFDYLANELKLTFQVNADWRIKIVDIYEDETCIWCRATPNSGKAGLNEVTISLSENLERQRRTGMIEIYSTYANGREMWLGRFKIHQDYKKTMAAIPVDLGLSVKWASFNIGAKSPEECGNCYAWGEIETKEEYSWLTYKWIVFENDEAKITKYYTEEIHTLEPEDDVAHVLWGDGWRMPTLEECKELAKSCSWEYTFVNSVAGYKWTSNINGNSIFFPIAAAYENNEIFYDEKTVILWTSMGYGGIWGFFFGFDDSLDDSLDESDGVLLRCWGLPVRPVMDK